MTNNMNNRPVDFSFQGAEPEFQKIKALKQGYDALSSREEGVKDSGFVNAAREKIFGKSQSSLLIDNSAALINKHFGVSVINRENDNATNRIALQNMLSYYINDLTTELDDKAKATGSLVTQFNVMKLKMSLLDLPIDSYDQKAVYEVLDSMDALGNAVASGLPIEKALAGSSVINRLEDSKNEYISRSLARQYDWQDNSLDAFLKGSIVGAGESAAGIADSIIGLAGTAFSMDPKTYKNFMLDKVRTILPNLTEEEERGITGQAGRSVGSLATALRFYGVPKSAQEAGVFLAVPKAFELLHEMGVPSSILDGAIGVANAGRALTITKGWYKGIKERMTYPTTEGQVQSTGGKAPATEVVNRSLKVIQEKVAELPLEAQELYATVVEPTIEDAIAKANTPRAESPADYSDPATASAMAYAQENSLATPIRHLEVSDVSQSLELDLKTLAQETNVVYNQLAEAVINNDRLVVNNSMYSELVGDNYAMRDLSKQGTGQVLQDFIVDVDTAFRETASKKYQQVEQIFKDTSLDNVDPNLRRKVIRDARYLAIDLKEDFFSPEKNIENGNEILRRKDIQDLRSAEPSLNRYTDQIIESIEVANAPGAVQATNRMISDLGMKVAELSKDNKSLQSAKISRALDQAHKFRERLYDTLDTLYPGAKDLASEANAYYRKTIGRLNDIIGAGKKTKLDINHVRSMTPESILVQYTSPAKASVFKKLNSLICQEVASNPPLHASYQNMMKQLWGHGLEQAKIHYDPSRGALLDGATKIAQELNKPNSFLSRLSYVDSSKDASLGSYKNMAQNIASHNKLMSNPSQSGIYLKNAIKKSVPFAGTVMDAVSGLKAETSAQRVRTLLDRVNNVGERIDYPNIVNTVSLFEMLMNSPKNMEAYTKMQTIKDKKREELDAVYGKTN